jgi:uncharacterized membrane protein
MTALAMLAFAGNSLLCRIALKHTGIDAASFTSIRLLSGAVMLVAVVRMTQGTLQFGGSWVSACALFAYAAGFSFAYISLPAATGALLLFGAVVAIGGLVAMLLPGLSAPPLLGSLLMLTAGMAWGVYSLRGKGAGDPTQATAGNFLRAVPVAAVLSLLTLIHASVDPAGVGYAVLSGALASGLGYAVWYGVLPLLKATNAATVQLSVPVIAALGGVALLGEPITLRLILASLAILGGIALVILKKANAPSTK